MKLFFLMTISMIAFSSFSQTWSWTRLSDMPFATSNNAVCEASIGNSKFVYSFGGIDNTKIHSGIHKRTFKYDVQNDTWSELDTMPDAVSKIASSASFVNGKIYVIGGYEVLASGNEISSNKVHVFNPTTDKFESNGTDIPIPIDDQVQCVYKDSLIFVVTGWSNNGNKPDVQIYNPALDSWQVGTPVPNSTFYRAFGASGSIVGDTIFYYGGASGLAFAARDFIRKGYINPNDPTDITWSLETQTINLSNGYRTGSSTSGNTVFWLGGSKVSYNYDGIAYNGSGGVSPSAEILHYNVSDSRYDALTDQPYGQMDLRGIAKLSETSWIIAGGMDSTQTVNGRTFLLESNSLDISNLEEEKVQIRYFDNEVQIDLKQSQKAKLVDVSGREIMRFERSKRFVIPSHLLPQGVYFFQSEKGSVMIRI